MTVRAPRKRSRLRTERIRAWPEFLQSVEGARALRGWAFRGQRDARWPLLSALSRHIRLAGIAETAWPRQEQRIRRIFERKSHHYLDHPPGDDELEWLALMQHHGAPTRLLDFTWSPYVAAYFALEHATGDAAVWALNLPLLWAIHREREIDGVRVEDADPRDRARYEAFYLPNERAFVWQGDPFRMPRRVIAQSGTFLVPGKLGVGLDAILAGYPRGDELLVQWVFDTEKVRRDAMASLYSMNVTAATLYPGLDGLARSLAYEFEYSWEIDPETGEPWVPDPKVPNPRD
jgi:hypothetical protein